MGKKTKIQSNKQNVKAVHYDFAPEVHQQARKWSSLGYPRKHVHQFLCQTKYQALT